MSIDDQVQRERDMIARGIRRYREALAASRGSDAEWDGGGAAKQLHKLVHRVVPKIEEVQAVAKRRCRAGLATGARLAGWEHAVRSLPADVIAYITVKTMLQRCGGAWGEANRPGNVVGHMMSLEIRWRQARIEERKRANEAGEHDRIAVMRREVRVAKPRHISRWLSRINDVAEKSWPPSERYRIGSSLVQIVAAELPDVFEFQVYNEALLNGTVKTHVEVIMTPEFTQRIRALHREWAWASPWMAPMISPPRDWVRQENGACSGGYLTYDEDLIRTDVHVHSAELNQEIPQSVLDALNAIQATPWRVNQRVLDTIHGAVEAGLWDLFNVEGERDLPEALPDEVWAEMDKTQKGTHKHERRAVWDHNKRQTSRRMAFRRMVATADECRGFDQFYMPHFLDFRGRAYPLPQDFNPQSDDAARGMLEFAEGRPLGPSGLKWLAYQAATTFGLDKATRNEQYQWVLDNHEQLAMVARDPLHGVGLGVLVNAEEPWQFLAACIELDDALSGDPETYVSRLPITVDGSCNGLQHLSALNLDLEGARATNLTASPDRQDIYQIVADKVYARLLLDSHAVELADNWLGHVDRKVVKRAVMTTPYGLTPIGMRDQLLKDGHCDALPGDRHKNAGYLRDILREAIASTVTAASEVMGWLQDAADIHTYHQQPITWTTPTGFRVRQSYRQLRSTRIKTIVGAHQLRLEAFVAGELLEKHKQHLAVAPNVIHSFDAAHMMRVATAVHKGTSLCMVHDSFGTHACEMDSFGEIIRQEFVKIYRDNWLEKLDADFRANLPEEANMDPPPERGDFDIEEVTRSAFFFA